MNKLFFSLSVLCSAFSFAQDQLIILESYPSGQDFYVGKMKGLNQDIKNASVKLQLPACSIKERYNVAVLVESTGAIKFVKDDDVLNIANNKCAYDYSKKILPHLKRWIAARVDGQPVHALATFEVYPYKIFHSKEDQSQNIYNDAQFKNGLSEFRDLMADTFARLIKDNTNEQMMMTFVVNEAGMMEEVVFSGSFDEKVVAAGMDYVQKLNKKKMWKPATFNGVPVYQRFRMPIRQEFNFEQGLINQPEHSRQFQSRNSF